MKKLISLILVLVTVMTLSACGKVEVTMQEIYDANQTEALLKNHRSVYVQTEMDDEFWSETYLTKAYVYDFVPGEEYDWVEFTTDNSNYYYLNGEYVRLFSITPDGVSSDFASYRADRYASVVLGADTANEIIESVSKKDGRIALNSLWGQETIAELADTGVTSGKFEYVLDAKTYEVFSVLDDYSFNDGTAMQSITTVSYDAEEPEHVRAILKYENETENLRNITIVNNPGTDKEVSQSFQIPKGLIIGFRYEDEDYVFEVYTDAACTEAYDPHANTESDETVYVKWVD